MDDPRRPQRLGRTFTSDLRAGDSRDRSTPPGTAAAVAINAVPGGTGPGEVQPPPIAGYVRGLLNRDRIGASYLENLWRPDAARRNEVDQ